VHRSEEELIGTTLSAGADNALLLFGRPSEIGGVELRTHSTTLYNSICLIEKKIFTNHHIYGIPAMKSPVVEIVHTLSPYMFETYSQSLE